MQGLQFILIEDLHDLPFIDVAIQPFTVNVSGWSRAVSDMSIYLHMKKVADSFGISLLLMFTLTSRPVTSTSEILTGNPLLSPGYSV